jgi:site-specific recombinase XerD
MPMRGVIEPKEDLFGRDACVSGLNGIGKAGLRGESLHTLLHSYGSHLLSEGIPLPAVSKLLRHGGIYITANV